MFSEFNANTLPVYLDVDSHGSTKVAERLRRVELVLKK